MKITLPDGSIRELADGSSGLDLASDIGPGLAKAAVAVIVNGIQKDLSDPIDQDSEVSIITIDSDEGSGDFINSAALDSDNNYLYTSGASKIYKYKLSETSATSSTITNDLLTTAPTAFKTSTFVTTTLSPQST